MHNYAIINFGYRIKSIKYLQWSVLLTVNWFALAGLKSEKHLSVCFKQSEQRSVCYASDTNEVEINYTASKFEFLWADLLSLIQPWLHFQRGIHRLRISRSLSHALKTFTTDKWILYWGSRTGEDRRRQLGFSLWASVEVPASLTATESCALYPSRLHLSLGRSAWVYTRCQRGMWCNKPGLGEIRCWLRLRICGFVKCIPRIAIMLLQQSIYCWQAQVWMKF